MLGILAFSGCHRDLKSHSVTFYKLLTILSSWKWPYEIPKKCQEIVRKPWEHYTRSINKTKALGGHIEQNLYFCLCTISFSDFLEATPCLLADPILWFQLMYVRFCFVLVPVWRPRLKKELYEHIEWFLTFLVFVILHWFCKVWARSIKVIRFSLSQN